MQKRIVTMLLAAALLVSGVLSILSIHGLQGNARIINYTGVVRGATQRLIKQEMNGQHNDALIARLDGILNELATGQGDNGLLRLENDAFQELIAQMQDQWEEIKDEIRQVRQGTDKTELYRLSEAYFELADRTVSAAEEYSEQQVERAEQGFFILGAAVIILTLFLVRRMPTGSGANIWTACPRTCVRRWMPFRNFCMSVMWRAMTFSS